MKTLPGQTSQSGATALQFSQEDSLASHSVMPDGEEARRMTATSGRSCCAALNRSDPVGLLARMLLESPRWHSPVRMLRWESKPIFSERVTRSMRSTSDTSSTKSARVLSEQDIPSSRCLFRLVPWELRTEGTGCSSLRTEMQSLPTPSAMDWKGCTNPGVRKEGSGYIYGETLPDTVNRWTKEGLLQFLPTPQAIECEKFTNKYNPNSQMGQSLSAMAGSGMLPTPIARDGIGGAHQVQNGKRKTEGKDYQPFSASLKDCFYQKTDGEPFRLSPLFTEEMMGFPFLWTTLPFLSANGSEKA